MKLLLIFCALIGLNSCNTTIGIYRDTKAGFLWTKDRIQGMSSGGGGDGGGDVYEEDYGAPIY